MPAQRRPMALIVLDGWGLSANPEWNAVTAAQTPNFGRIWNDYPHTRLEASGEAVGLLPGQMGDSNVGHLNLGAGRIVYQTLVRIHRAIADGSFARLQAWRTALERVQASGGTLHLMGLVSDGGVHSHLLHLFALIDMAAAAGITGERLLVHAFLDGRDVAPTSAGGYLERLEAKLAAIGGRIATLSGRYYAMDRDRRWERTERAFRTLYLGEGHTAPTAAAALAAAYARGETDEFVQPTVLVADVGTGAGGAGTGAGRGAGTGAGRGAGTGAGRGAGTALIAPGDTAIFFNFRADRARQMCRALWETHFEGFRRPDGFVPVDLVAMMPYDQTLHIPSAFPSEFIKTPLGQVVSEAGLRQLRIAETEKYPHVTYFFNGGEEHVFPGEERVMIPSPKVATYDLQPEMSASQVAAEAVRWIREDRMDFMVLNFANPDMVGHTGVFAATVQACAAVDLCLGQVLAALAERDGAAIILADHGNAEHMVDTVTGQPHTNHTLNLVPCVLVDDHRRHCRMRPGILANVAPTLCELMELTQPAEMDQNSLLEA